MIICSRKSGISDDISSGEIFGRLLVVLLLETRSLYIYTFRRSASFQSPRYSIGNNCDVMTSSCRAMILVSYVPHVHALYKEK